MAAPATRPAPKCYHYLELTRLHKFPLGAILIFWPCAWGLTMAAYKTSLPPTSLVKELALFLLGSTILHCAACVLNDIADRDIDGRVARTKLRPLVTGVVSLFEARMLLALLTVCSVGMLLLCDKHAIAYGLIDLFPLHAFYPWMKRWTWWPQAWLGLTLNWSYIVVWSNVAGPGEVRLPFVVVLGALCWTIVYDSMYGYQDREDDIKAGVKSTALLFGTWIRPILAFFTTFFVLCMIIAGLINQHGPAYFIMSCGGAALHFIAQFLTWDMDNATDGAKLFVANHHTGYIIWSGMLVDYYLKVIA